ncbi:MAG: hypothetical protein KDK71_09695, partial [Chlamydiia bacterium]|nr:hypothetical protein [Chlamydiia bacterium]
KLEKNDPCQPTKKKESPKEQLSFFEDPPSPFEKLGEELQTLDLDHMTPLQALQLLSAWKEKYF